MNRCGLRCQSPRLGASWPSVPASIAPFDHALPDGESFCGVASSLPSSSSSSSSSSPRLSRRRRRLARWRRRRRRAIRTQLIPTSPPRAPRSHVVSRSTLNEIRTVRRVPSRGGRGGVNGIDGDDENDGEVDADASVAVVALGAPTRTTRGKIAVLLDASSDGAQSKRPELASGFTGERE